MDSEKSLNLFNEKINNKLPNYLFLHYVSFILKIKK